MTFSYSTTTFELLVMSNLLGKRTNIVIYRTGPIQKFFYPELTIVLETLAVYYSEV